MRHKGELKRSLQEEVPAEFLRTLEKLLEDESEHRHSSAGELLEELRALRSDHAPLLAKTGEGEKENEEPVAIVAVVSAYPGSGATIASLALSATLSRLGVDHALVECPGSEGELYSLLDGTRRMPKGAVYSGAGGEQAAVPAWRRGKAAYYPLNPSDGGRHLPDGAFANWLKRLGVPFVILDVSSRWEQSQIKEWLPRSVTHLAIVADCFPGKWTARRQSSCLDLVHEAYNHRIGCAWFANRDQSFSERKQWLSLFPKKPEVSIPDLGSRTVLNALWRGEGIPNDEATLQAIESSFHRWLSTVIK
jgi:serine/threonine-protein kinase